MNIAYISPGPPSAQHQIVAIRRGPSVLETAFTRNATTLHISITRATFHIATSCIWDN